MQIYIKKFPSLKEYNGYLTLFEESNLTKKNIILANYNYLASIKIIENYYRFYSFDLNEGIVVDIICNYYVMVNRKK